MEYFDMYPLHKAMKDGDVHNTGLILNTNKHLLVAEEPFKNWTPIHWAAYSGHLQCLTQALSCEPDAVNIQSSKTFQTPLHSAVEGGQPQCVLFLLQAGVNPEVKDNFGETALHKAARVGNAECVHILSSSTINICSQNLYGQTASMLAEMSGHSAIASYIREREMSGNAMQNRLSSFPVVPRLNRKRTRDMYERDSPIKRQRSFELNTIPLPQMTIMNPLTSSVMEHEDLCGSEAQYTYSMYESMVRECHGC